MTPYQDDWLTDSFGGNTWYVGGALDYASLWPRGNMSHDHGAQGNFKVPGILDINSQNGGAVRGVKIGQITDGTSNTLIMGESTRPDSSEWSMGQKIGILSDEDVGRMGDAWQDWQNIGGGAWRGIVPGGNNAGNSNADVSGNCTINCDNFWNFYSFHTGGAHFVMADGTVRFVSQNMAAITMNRLFSYGDGAVVGEF